MTQVLVAPVGKAGTGDVVQPQFVFEIQHRALPMLEERFLVRQQLIVGAEQPIVVDPRTSCVEPSTWSTPDVHGARSNV